MSSILEVNGVSKKYGSKLALNQVNLTLGPGKIAGLLGTNGSGKSTLMKIIAGLMKPASGTVQVAGTPVGVQTKAMVSFMPDVPLTESWMKVRDAVAYYQDFYADFDLEKAWHMLDFMNLNENQRVTSLSKGMLERLQLTLVMSRNARLYLLDEPIGGVDPAARSKILDAIVKFYNEDSSLIISTHMVHDIERIFDEVIFLRQGEIILHEEVDQIRMNHGQSVDELFRGVFAE